MLIWDQLTTSKCDLDYKYIYINKFQYLKKLIYNVFINVRSKSVCLVWLEIVSSINTCKHKYQMIMWLCDWLSDLIELSNSLVCKCICTIYGVETNKSAIHRRGGYLTEQYFQTHPIKKINKQKLSTKKRIELDLNEFGLYVH